MRKIKEKTSFETIWKYIKFMDTVIGLFLFQDPSKKRTVLEKFLSFTLIRQAIPVTILIVSTLIVFNFKLISVIFVASLMTFEMAWYFTLGTMILKKEVLKDVLKWCEGLYDVEKRFHKVVQKAAEIHLISMERRTTKLYTWKI